MLAWLFGGRFYPEPAFILRPGRVLAKPDYAIAGMLGHTSVTIAGAHAKIVDKIAENPARYFEDLMGFS